MNHNKLLIATTNSAKFREISEFLKPVPFDLVGLSDVSVKSQPEETGNTFAENALLKARYYHNLTGLPTLADDGGFEIAALGGEPGIHSHRWVNKDRDATDEELIAYTYERMKGIPIEKRKAQLTVVLAFVCCRLEQTKTASVKGVVASEPLAVRTPGFPYRSVLYLPEIGKYYNEDVLTPAESARLNHRKQAVEAIKPVITDHIGI